ncbi:hypothetical protein GCM10011529_17870 [Polymorphobacter glacialis]|uniref:Autotransporter domain-containing protein n=1 Tax=Sandarakinorhabdus glacialis TaxID=1614636 RepID=A0A917E9B4_9SPHN|nr:autotransporter domain-containing protein [Polymorphobacter glacialis]GGE11968.1 hypothetical protein GCM10011529_17870 [Polymorphobacter glacialis]
MIVAVQKHRASRPSSVLYRRIKVGLSVTGLMLAGTALAPASAEVLNLNGISPARSTVAGATEITNGILRLTPAVGGVTIDAALNDRLGVFALTKLGQHSLTLNGSGLNTYSGATTISDGAVFAGNVNVLSPNSVVTLAAPGVLDLRGYRQAVAGLAGFGIVRSSTATTSLLTVGAAGTYNYRGVIEGNLRLVKTGADQQSLGGSNTYTGGTELRSGILRFTRDDSLGTGAIDVTGAAVLLPAIMGRRIANDFSLGGDLEVSGASMELAGRISGTGRLIKTTVSNLTLSSGANSFSGGVDLQDGQLVIATGSLGSGDLVVSAGQASMSTVGNLSAVLRNRVVLLGGLNFELLDAASVLELSGPISGGGFLYMKQGPGTLLLTGDNGFTGHFSLATGTLGLGTSTAAGFGILSTGGGAGIAAYADNLVVANRIHLGPALRIDTRGYDLTLTGAIINNTNVAGGFQKLGDGNLTLTGVSSFTGPATIITGQLTMNGSITSDAAIGSGAILAGSGSIGGVVTVADGARIAPGTSAGTLTLGSLVLGAGSVLDFELKTAGAIGGGINDLIAVNNSLTLDGTINVVGLPGFDVGTFRVINYGGALTNNGLDAGTVPVGFNFTIDTSVQGQVNLLVGFAGVRYWDGADVVGDGVIDGGNGTWASGATNWTNVDGSANLSWGNTTGIFAGAPGTVAVAGVQGFTALSFQTAGYVLNGGELAINGGTLETANTGTTTINSVVSGSNGLTKTGAGSLVLDGANTYAGGTTLAQGTITAASNTALGAGALTMASGTTLASAGASRSLANNIVATGNDMVRAGTVATDVLTLAGTISGSGSITQVGPGNLVLTGNNSFGRLGIAAGMVTIGTNTSAGTGPIAIDNGGTLAAGVTGLALNNAIQVATSGVVNVGSGALTLGGTMGGAGNITKTGTGVLNLTAVSSLTGATTVSAGRLNIIGSIAQSATTVQSGATLAGTGTVGALTAQSGSAISPGAAVGSVGTLNVNGAVSLLAGSTFIVDYGPASVDRLTATGPASIAGNISVVPAAAGRFGETIILSSSARTGTFANDASVASLFGPAITSKLLYTSTSVVLSLTPTSLASLGNLTGNPLQVALAFDRAVTTGYNPSPYFALFTQGANFSTALSQLSGELHSAERRVLLEDSRVVRETAWDRMNAGLSAIAGAQSVTADDGDLATTVWLRAAGSWGQADADGVGSAFETEQRGVLTGMDFATNGFKAGAMFYYLETDIEFATLGKSTVESTGGAIYAGYRQPGAGFAVGLGGSMAGNRAEGVRSITIPGLAQTLTSRVSGTTYQIFGEVAFDLLAAENSRIEPFGRVAHAQVKSNALTEAGGMAARHIPGQRNEMTWVDVGLRGGITAGEVDFTGSAAWHRTSGDRNGITYSSLGGLNTQSFIRAVELDRDAVALEAQANYSITPMIKIGAGYSGIIGSNNQDHGARATLSFGF